jgi:hypothetical protein
VNLGEIMSAVRKLGVIGVIGVVAMMLMLAGGTSSATPTATTTAAKTAAPESKTAARIEETSSISDSRLTYLAMAFSGRQDGAILDSVAPSRSSGRCALALYTTRDGATRWSGPLVFGNGAPCFDNLATGQESLSVTSDGAWWVAIANKLYTGTLVSSSAKDVSIPGGAHACSVTASGSTVYVAIETNGSCWTPTGLLRSTDSGTTWSKVVPIDRFRNDLVQGPIVARQTRRLAHCGCGGGSDGRLGGGHRMAAGGVSPEAAALEGSPCGGERVRRRKMVHEHPALQGGSREEDLVDAGPGDIVWEAISRRLSRTGIRGYDGDRDRHLERRRSQVVRALWLLVVRLWQHDEQVPGLREPDRHRHRAQWCARDV